MPLGKRPFLLTVRAVLFELLRSTLDNCRFRLEESIVSPVTPPADDALAASHGHAGTLALANRIEDLLPQTQCTKCGFSGCRPYAEAIAAGAASYNQCPPGGMEGVARLAHLLGKPVIPLNPVNGIERPRPVARIDEARCIGCTLCIQACPVDAILGAAKQMHVILTSLCTGCDLCVAPCPVDCIEMIPLAPPLSGWAGWSQQEADAARARHDFRTARLARERQENETKLAAKAAAKLREIASEMPGTQAEIAERERKKLILAAAIERARLRAIEAQAGATPPGRPPPPPKEPT